MIQSIKTSLFDCFHYREVLYNILSQDLKVKYRRTFLGYFWSLLNPILQLAILAVIFSHITRISMKDYTLYLFSGMVVWTLMQTALIAAARSLIDNEHFIKKVYLPKLIFPLSKLCLRSIDFFFSLVALLALGMVIGFSIPYTIGLLPFAIVSLLIFTFGLCLMLSVATVYFRDVEYLLTVFLQMLYFATPILYPITALPQKYHFILGLNPFYTQIHLFHQLIYFGQVPTGQQWLLAFGVAFVSFGVGLGVLLKFEDDLVFRM